MMRTMRSLALIMPALLKSALTAQSQPHYALENNCKDKRE